MYVILELFFKDTYKLCTFLLAAANDKLNFVKVKKIKQLSYKIMF